MSTILYSKYFSPQYKQKKTYQVALVSLGDSERANQEKGEESDTIVLVLEIHRVL